MARSAAMFIDGDNQNESSEEEELPNFGGNKKMKVNKNSDQFNLMEKQELYQQRKQ